MWVSHSPVSCRRTLNVTQFFLWIHTVWGFWSVLNFPPFGWCLRTPQTLPGHQQIIHINRVILQGKKNQTSYYVINISAICTQTSIWLCHFFSWQYLVESLHTKVHICWLKCIKICLHITILYLARNKYMWTHTVKIRNILITPWFLDFFFHS